MPTETYRFGGGLTETALHPLVLVAMLISIALIFVLPRRQVIVPFLLQVTLVPQGQEAVLLGLHFMVLRILVIFACVRVFLIEPDHSSRSMNCLDRAFLLWAISRALAVTILWGQGAAVINQCGFLLDSLGAYAVLRTLINDEDDIRRVIKVLIVIIIINAASMTVERLLLRNVFGYLGGFPLSPAIRDGKIRAQGVFQHAILAGVYGATCLPLLFWLWRYGKSRFLAASGIIGSLIMVVASASSTPILACLAGVLGWCMWPIRREMRVVRLALLLALAVCAICMKAPVWFIIAHIDVVGSSSGYHRAMLIDQFVNHFGDWWLMGAMNNDKWGWDMWDTQNEFVAQGVTGGIIAFGAFLALLSRGFRELGRARRAAEGDPRRAWLLWALGALLFAHVVAFFGADYFDQTKIVWFAALAMIGTAADKRPQIKPEREETDNPDPEVKTGPSSTTSDDWWGGERTLGNLSSC